MDFELQNFVNHETDKNLYDFFVSHQYTSLKWLLSSPLYIRLYKITNNDINRLDIEIIKK